MDGDKLEELEAIRRRHEARKREFGVTENMIYVGSPAIENDFATLLALLDAARAELAGVREAADEAIKHADARGMLDWPIFRRLAAALQDTPTETGAE